MIFRVVLQYTASKTGTPGNAGGAPHVASFFGLAPKTPWSAAELAAAFVPDLIGIERINRAFKECASVLAHSKGYASGKNYAALGWGAGALGQPFEIQDVDN